MHWIVVGRQLYSENTGQYGYGDYPADLLYIRAAVEADTIRKAQNAAKKIDSRISFGGKFGDFIMPITDDWAKSFLVSPDPRLGSNAKLRHETALKTLGINDPH